MKMLPIAFALITTPTLVFGLDVGVGGTSANVGSSGASVSSSSGGGTRASASLDTGGSNTVSTSASVTTGRNGAIANVNAHVGTDFGSGVKINVDGTISLTTNTVVWGSGGQALGRAAGKCAGGIIVMPFGNDAIASRRACIKASSARVKNGELVVDLSRATFLNAFQ